MEQTVQWFGTKKQSKQKKRNPKSVKSSPGSNTNATTMKHLSKQQKNGVGISESEQQVPPAYLHPTASPHAYVASCALEEMSDDDTGEQNGLEVARSLFAEPGLPPSFAGGAGLHYLSPKLLDHDLPTYKKHQVALPEVALLGRSNVGKSSLLNALTRNKQAHTSKRPGRTQQVNYYALVKNEEKWNDKEFRPLVDSVGFVVDLPGYGYAKAPDKAVDQWQTKTQEFLLARRDLGVLRRVYLLLDARHLDGTVNQMDRAIMRWFDEAEIPYVLCLTKCDLVSLPQQIRAANNMCMRYHSQLYGEGDGFQSPVIIMTSSKNKGGVREILWTMDGDFNMTKEEILQSTMDEEDHDYDFNDEDGNDDDGSLGDGVQLDEFDLYDDEASEEIIAPSEEMLEERNKEH
jgi:GTP-binding protein